MDASFLNYEPDYILPAVRDSAILSQHLEKQPGHRVGCCVFKKEGEEQLLVWLLPLYYVEEPCRIMFNKGVSDPYSLQVRGEREFLL